MRKPTNQMTTTAKPITKIIDLTLNGFHGFQSRSVRATFTRREAVEGGWTPYGLDKPEEAGYIVTIAHSAASKFACASPDCCCRESMPTKFACDEYDFEHADITLKGNYPQP